MFQFKIHEIAGGKSTEEVSLDTASEVLALDQLKSGHVKIEFDKSLRLIQAILSLDAVFERICDRSLEPYDQKVEIVHKVLFKTDLEDDIDETELSMRRLQLESNQIDLTDIIRDTLLLALPIRSLHPKFLDENGEAVDFEVRHFGPTDPEPDNVELVDQRWAKLKQLKEQTEQ